MLPFYCVTGVYKHWFARHVCVSVWVTVVTIRGADFLFSSSLISLIRGADSTCFDFPDLYLLDLISFDLSDPLI